MARVDDQQAPGRVADVLDVVRDAGVPGQVVAGTELDGVLALRHAPATAEHHVMLVAGMRVDACPVPRRHDRLDDAKVPRRAAVDLRGFRQVAGRSAGSVRGAHDARGRAGVHQEPRHGHVERSRDLAERVEGRHRLLVLDLREVADVEAAPLRDPGESHCALATPAVDLPADRRAPGASRLIFDLGQPS